MNNEEESKELTRSSFAAQMAMLGYEPNGNPKDMVEVVRCKECKFLSTGVPHLCWHGRRKETDTDDWFCADGKRRETK